MAARMDDNRHDRTETVTSRQFITRLAVGPESRTEKSSEGEQLMPLGDSSFLEQFIYLVFVVVNNERSHSMDYNDHNCQTVRFPN